MGKSIDYHYTSSGFSIILNKEGNQMEQGLNQENNFISLKPREYPVLPREITYEPIFISKLPGMTIAQYIEQCMERYANRIAIKMGSHQFTYQTVYNEASKVASTILEENFHENETVALLFNHGLDMIMGIIGAFLSGKTFVCLDTATPVNKLHEIIKDANIKVLIVGENMESLLDDLHFSEEDHISVRFYKQIKQKKDGVNYKRPHIEEQDSTLLLYTSGSSGKPKGVIQTHRNILFHIAAYINSLSINQNDRVALLTNYTHAVAFIDLLSTFFTGAILLPYNVRSSSEEVKLHTWLKDEKITVYHSVPTLYRYVMNNLKQDEVLNDLRLIVLGGESVNVKDWELYRLHCKESCVFVNFYGASEVLTASFCYLDHHIAPDKNLIPIGRFVEGVNVTLKNRDELTSENQVGEIVYESEFITPGYWNSTHLPVEATPFECNGSVRIFQSGDMGRLLPDGQMEYLGRNDNMVKIKGHRVELAEIEATILSLFPIDKCLIVVELTKQDEKTLVLYYTTNNKEKLDEKASFHILRKSFPTYMIPSQLIYIEEFPLTPNGKIDRNKILQLAKVSEDNIQQPFNEIQKGLAAIWTSLLKVEDITLQKNFIQMGGNSLHMMSLIQEVKFQFGIDLNIVELFEVLKFVDMAALIEEKMKEENVPSELPVESQLNNVTTFVEKTAEKEYIPLSSSQKRIFLHMAQTASETAYNQTIAFQVDGYLDVDKVKGVFQQLVDRHQILRTSICTIHGIPMQEIKTNVKIDLEIYKCTEENVTNRMNEFIRKFDISEPPLFRVGVLAISERKNIIIIDVHHIIADEASVTILLNEFSILYSGGTLPIQEYDYFDYIQGEDNAANDFLLQKQAKYWKKRFSEPVSPYILPQVADLKTKTVTQEAVHFNINVDTTESLKKLSYENNTTLFTVLLAVYNILLFRYNATEDIVVSIPVAGRNTIEQKKMLGLFINMLPILSHINSEMSFQDMIMEVRSSVLQALDHQDMPFEQIVEEIQGHNHADRSSLFNLLFVLQIMNHTTPQVSELLFKRYDVGANNTAYDLAMEAMEEEDGIHFICKYNPLRLNQEFVQDLATHYLAIVKQLVVDPNSLILDFPILTDLDIDKLDKFNDTTTDFPINMTINKMFENQVVKSSKHAAVKYQDIVLSYDEFNIRTNQLAGFLLDKKVKRNQIVGIMLQRSQYMPLAIMAIHKAGAAYLPISPDYPVSRISYMLEDSKVDILLTDSRVMTELDFSGEVVCLDELDTTSYDGSKDISICKPEDIAYVIYTSGTTGLPKAVAVQHRSIINFLVWMQSKFHISNKSVILLKTPFVFDASMREILWWGMYGSTLSVLEQGDEKDPVKIVEAIKKSNVTHINFVPSMLNAFLLYMENNPSEIDKCNSLEYVFSCGEALTASMVRRFYKLFSKPVLCDLYGPTEATVDVTYYICDRDNIPDVIPIGKPLNNSRIYILNKYKQLQPIGAVGELCIAGDCVSAGYINNQEATNQKFIDNPFEESGKLYTTGDLARWLPDGSIHYIGRMDNQIKIRGYRIEMDEIKKHLLKIDNIKETIIVDYVDNSGNKFLCAYCIFNKIMTVAEIRQELMNYLPEYMIPEVFVSITSIPTNINGKLAKDKLPEPVSNLQTGSIYCPPENEMQQILADVWSEILGVDKVGIYDNFFHLGGNSIKAMQVISKLQMNHNIELPLNKLYHLFTINELTEYIHKKDNSTFELKKAEYSEYYPLSSAQKRIFLSSLFKSSANDDNNATIAFSMEGEIDFIKLESAFQTLLERHEILRTSYFIQDGEPVQKINDNVKLNLYRVQAEPSKLENIFNDFNTTFNLESAPLIKVLVATLTPSTHILYICIHHIAFDGFSRNILIKEISDLYQGIQLDELFYQYKDYAVWQNEQINSKEMRLSKEYWLKQFSNANFEDELFIDYPRPKVMDFHGESLMFELSPELTKKLNNLANELQVSLFIVMFTMYIILLKKYSGLSDITVGIPSVGRSKPEFEQMMGMFVNTLPIRTYPSYQKGFTDLVVEVNETFINAFIHQDYQYDMLVRALDLKPDLGRNAIFDTMFAFQNIETQNLEIPNIITKHYSVIDQATIFDSVLYVYDGDALEFKLTFSEKLYKKSTMESFIGDYKLIIDQICNNPSILMNELITEKDKERNNSLLSQTIEFNF